MLGENLNLKSTFFLGFNRMLNFLCINLSRLNTLEYFAYIIQFDDSIQAELWFLENEVETNEIPYYRDGLEFSPFTNNELITIQNTLKQFNISKLKLIESESYKVLCLSEKTFQDFIAERISKVKSENLEMTDVDKSFLLGFVD